MHSRLELGRKKVSMSLVVAALASAWATAVLAQTTVTWDGSTNMTWTQPDSTSWRGATYESGNTAVFAGTGTGTVTISGTVTPGQINVTAGSYTLSGAIGGGGGIAKGGSGTLTLSGSTANTYSGTTTVSAGRLELGKTANVTAVAGDLVITGAAVTFGGNNQIASTAAVTMSGTGAGFNGTGFNLNNNTQLDQTLASLTVTGGVVNTNSKSTSGETGASTGLTVNGAVSVTGGAGNTDFWFGSGGLGSFGSLALVGMTGTANPSSRANNTFRLFGNSVARQTLVTIGSGGLSLDGSTILLAGGSVQSALGSRLVLNGDVTTVGSSASQIREVTSGGGTNGSNGTRQIALSGSAGTVTRSFTVGGGGANLSLLAEITNGSATTAGIRKQGAGTLTLGNANTYTGGTTISAGRLEVAAGGRINSTSRVTLAGVGAELKYNSTTALTAPITFTQGTISGTGTIGTAVTVGGGDILSPGNSPGSQAYTSGLAWNPGGTYVWETNALSGTTGTNWDVIAVSGGALDLSGLSSGNRFVLDLTTLGAGDTPGTLVGGYEPGTYAFDIATFSSLLVPDGYAASANSILTDLFSFNELVNWQGTQPSSLTLKVNSSGNGLQLNLVIVPEPTAVAIAGMGILLAGWSLVRRRGKTACHPE